jgi:hypothetical protein
MTRRGVLLSLALVVSAFLLISALDAASQTVDSYTIGRVVRFAPGSDKVQTALQRTPSTREIIAGDFVMAAEDLDDDGHREIIVRARSSLRVLRLSRRSSSPPEATIRKQPSEISSARESLVAGRQGF